MVIRNGMTCGLAGKERGDKCPHAGKIVPWLCCVAACMSRARLSSEASAFGHMAPSLIPPLRIKARRTVTVASLTGIPFSQPLLS
jgi:hypothetical protein